MTSAVDKKTISAVVLTKNEEKNLNQCLEHLRWVDDLVIIDSGSTDQTLEITKKFDARVFVNIPDKFYIAEQRNWALDNTGIKSDWVLFIDADEVVTEALRKEILDAVSNAPLDVTAFQLCPKVIFLNKWLKHVCHFPAWHDRLLSFKKARFKGEVWESFDTAGKVAKIYEPYLHYSFNNGIDVWIDKHQRYASWHAQKLFELENSSKFSLGSSLSGLFSGEARKRYRALERIAVKFGWISPGLNFFFHYFLKGGFLDGVPGFIYSKMMAMYQLMIYLYFIENKNRTKQ